MFSYLFFSLTGLAAWSYTQSTVTTTRHGYKRQYAVQIYGGKWGWNYHHSTYRNWFEFYINKKPPTRVNYLDYVFLNE